MSVYLFSMVYKKTEDSSDTIAKLEYKISLLYQTLKLKQTSWDDDSESYWIEKLQRIWRSDLCRSLKVGPHMRAWSKDHMDDMLSDR
jgi:hypothetical protein